MRNLRRRAVWWLAPSYARPERRHELDHLDRVAGRYAARRARALADRARRVGVANLTPAARLELIEAIRAMPVGIERLALAHLVYGRSAADLIVRVNASAAAFGEAMAQVAAVMSTVGVAVAELRRRIEEGAA